MGTYAQWHADYLAASARGWCVSCSSGLHKTCGGTACACDCIAFVPLDTEERPISQTPTADTFGSAVREAVKGTLDIEGERASAYGDTWHVREFETSTFLDHVLSRLGVMTTAAQRRLITAAAHVDQKDRRLALGTWKDDHVEDGNNYRAAFLTWWREEYG